MQNIQGVVKQNICYLCLLAFLFFYLTEK